MTRTSAGHEVLFSAEQIDAAVDRIAGEVDAGLVAKTLVVVAVLKGALFFAADLARALSTPTEFVFVTASSYADGFTPGDSLNLTLGSGTEYQGRSVLIVDDIVDTGRTQHAIKEHIEGHLPERVATAALVSKTSRRSEGLDPDFSGFEIGDEFVYGYGMDWDERFRDLPFIALADPDNPPQVPGQG